MESPGQSTGRLQATVNAMEIYDVEQDEADAELAVHAG
jgi:hypothetical protein